MSCIFSFQRGGKPLGYTVRMAKKKTLDEIAEMLTQVVKHMATTEELANVRRDMAT